MHLRRCPANDISWVFFGHVSLTGSTVRSRFLPLGLTTGVFFIVLLESILTDVTGCSSPGEEVTHHFGGEVGVLFFDRALLSGVVVLLDLGQTALLDVSLDVEVGEESHEHDRVEAHSVGDDDRVVAAVEKELNSVQENDDELDHLHGGQILLPPEIFLVLRSHSSHQVVAVHDHVDEGVEHTEEGAVTSGSELDTPPASSRHHAVVDNVQVGDLVVLFAQDEEDGVQEFSELAEEVPPAHVRHGNLIRIVRIVDRLAFQTVLPEPGVDQTLVDEVDASDNLDEVVGDDGLLQVHGLAIAHQPRSQRLDEVDVAGAYSQGVERRAHQKPVINPRISFIDH